MIFRVGRKLENFAFICPFPKILPNPILEVEGTHLSHKYPCSLPMQLVRQS